MYICMYVYIYIYIDSMCDAVRMSGKEKPWTPSAQRLAKFSLARTAGMPNCTIST